MLAHLLIILNFTLLTLQQSVGLGTCQKRNGIYSHADKQSPSHTPHESDRHYDYVDVSQTVPPIHPHMTLSTPTNSNVKGVQARRPPRQGWPPKAASRRRMTTDASGQGWPPRPASPRSRQPPTASGQPPAVSVQRHPTPPAQTAARPPPRGPGPSATGSWLRASHQPRTTSGQPPAPSGQRPDSRGISTPPGQTTAGQLPRHRSTRGESYFWTHCFCILNFRTVGKYKQNVTKM